MRAINWNWKALGFGGLIGLVVVLAQFRLEWRIAANENAYLFGKARMRITNPNSVIHIISTSTVITTDGKIWVHKGGVWKVWRQSVRRG